MGHIGGRRALSPPRHSCFQNTGHCREVHGHCGVVHVSGGLTVLPPGSQDKFPQGCLL